MRLHTLEVLVFFAFPVFLVSLNPGSPSHAMERSFLRSQIPPASHVFPEHAVVRSYVAFNTPDATSCGLDSRQPKP